MSKYGKRVKSIFSSSIFWVAVIGGCVQCGKIINEIVLDGKPLDSARANGLLETLGGSLIFIILRINGGVPVYTPKGVFGPNIEDLINSGGVTTERSNIALSVPIEGMEEGRAQVAVETVKTTVPLEEAAAEASEERSPLTEANPMDIRRAGVMNNN